MANYVNFTKSFLNPYNPRVLNEGQFSWFTHDTDRQIGSERSNTIDVWMFDNQGNSWFEKGYEGYGEFGGMDYYELLARMNGYSEEDLEGRQELRGIGIDLAFDKLKTKDKGKKVLFPALIGNPTRFNHKRHDFTQEADSDPNQSWSESVKYAGGHTSINEWGSSDQSAMNKTIHNDAGKPKTMPSPFDKKLRRAAEDAVDFYWDDWEEYEDDRAGLIDDAVRGYLRQYFQKDFAMMQRMFEPMESVQVTEAMFSVKDLKKPGLIWWYNGKGDKAKVTKIDKIDNLSFPRAKDAPKDFDISWGMGTLDQWIEKTGEKNPKVGEIYDIDESLEITVTEARDWGTFGEFADDKKAVNTVTKTLDKALAKFEAALAKAHADYQKAVKDFTTGSKADMGRSSGFHDSEGPASVHHYTKHAIKKAFNMEEWGGGLDYKVGWMFEGLTWNSLKESLGLNERSINKIQKEYSQVVMDMSKTVEEWKAAEGDRKAELLAKLKELTNTKHKLHNELDAAVAGKDKDLQLAISESNEETK